MARSYLNDVVLAKELDTKSARLCGKVMVWGDKVNATAGLGGADRHLLRAVARQIVSSQKIDNDYT